MKGRRRKEEEVEFFIRFVPIEMPLLLKQSMSLTSPSTVYLPPPISTLCPRGHPPSARGCRSGARASLAASAAETKSGTDVDDAIDESASIPASQASSALRQSELKLKLMMRSSERRQEEEERHCLPSGRAKDETVFFVGFRFFFNFKF